MDSIPCVSCRESWDIEYMLRIAPKAFKRIGEIILQCPRCSPKVLTLDKEKKFKIETGKPMEDKNADML